jgi:hypothetical protein
MQVLEKYQSLGNHVVSDPRLQKYGAMIVKHGFKNAAKKLNPATIYIDAGLSVLSAVSSYLTYAAEREATQKLRIQNETLKQQLQAELSQINAQYKTALKAGTATIRDIERAVGLNKLKINELQAKLKDLLGMLSSWQNLIRQEREELGPFEQLMTLQKHMDSAIKQCLFVIQQELYTSPASQSGSCQKSKQRGTQHSTKRQNTSNEVIS